MLKIKMSRGDSQSMAEQIFKIAYCKVEQKETQFISTLSPKGSWCCTTCPFRTGKLLKSPAQELSQTFPYNYNQLNEGG